MLERLSTEYFTANVAIVFTDERRVFFIKVGHFDWLRNFQGIPCLFVTDV